MESGWQRTVLTSLCVVACVLLGLLASRFVGGAYGEPAPAILDAMRPTAAAVAVLVCLGAAVALAMSIARPINPVVALFAAGCGVAAFAMRCGNVNMAVFADGQFRWLGAETLGWGVFVAAASLLAWRVGGALPDVPWPDPQASLMRSVSRRKSLTMLLAAVLAPAVVAFTLVGPSKGQAIGACTLAGVAVAFGARLLAPREQPVLVFAAPVLVLGAVQLVMAGAMGAGLDRAFATGALPSLLAAMPADIAAGSLCGVAIGLGWSKGLVKPAESA
jgi:hypothetical protein